MTLLTNSDGGGNGTQGSGGNTGGAQGGAQGGSQGGSQSSGSQTSWRDSLPEELKTNTALMQFTDTVGLAKSYLSTKEMVGKKGVIVPGEKASDEEMAAFFKSIGQPELDKFEVKAPEGKQLSPEFVSKYKETAHKLGLLPKQAQAMMEFYLKGEEEAMTAEKTQKETLTKQGIENLKREWGQGYDKQVALAKLAVRELGGDDFQKHLETSGLGNDVMTIKVLAKAGALLGEDKIRGDANGRMGKTPAEIRKDIENIMGNKGHPYWDKSHPGHKSAVTEMEEKYKALSQ